MSYLIVPSRRIVRPPFGTRPNWDHPLFGGKLPLALYSGWENRDWVDLQDSLFLPIFVTTTGTVTFNAASSGGIGMQTASGTNYVTLNRSCAIAGYPFTVFAVYVPTSAVSTDNIGLACVNAGTANYSNLTIGRANSASFNPYVYVGDGAGAASTNRREFDFIVAGGAVNRVEAFACVVRSTTTGVGFINGINAPLTASGTGASIAAGASNARIGYRAAGLISGDKNILLIGWRDGDVGDAVTQRFSEFPWEIFSAPRRFIFNPAAVMLGQVCL